MFDKKVLSVLKMLYSRKSSVSMLEYFIIVPILIVVTALWLFGFYLFVHVAGAVLLIAHQEVFTWNEPTVLEVIGKTIGAFFLFHLDNVLLYDVYFTIRWMYNFLIV